MTKPVDLSLLGQLRGLIDTRQYWRVERQLSAMERDWLVAEPALGYALAVAYIHLRKSRKGLQLTEQILAHHDSRTDSLLQEIELFHSIFLGREGRLREAESVAVRCLGGAGASQGGKYAASANNNLGVLLCQKGDWEGAISALQRALALYGQIGRPLGAASVSHNIGMTYRYMGQCGEAERYYLAASEYYSTHGTVEEDTFTEAERSLAILGLGDSRLALRMAERAVERCRRIGNIELLGEVLRIVGIVYREVERPAESQRALREAYRYATRCDNAQLKAEVQLETGLLEWSVGRRRIAARCFSHAETHFRRTGAIGWERMASGYREIMASGTRHEDSKETSAIGREGSIVEKTRSSSGSNDPQSDVIISRASIDVSG